MNPTSVLGLVVSLYEQIITLNTENAELKQQLAEAVTKEE